ncbi:methyltransferase [Streptomyces sp. PTM05]|uniref:Methyltransferase n=1 Tax=Streptantibioticus parmotrematis TaxID=2873249 RepID=A0ABS7QUG1_9ACTN|nr:methyltransferase [Streptantibioticus parmotrematis]MBY8886351.1 methyltransferase [Streptantibioticus parmotrematis]
MRLRELVFGCACAGAVRAAARLGLADALDDGSSLSASVLAERVDAHPGALARLLRALSSYGVFEQQPDGTFAHTSMSRMLRADAPDSLHHIALWCTEPWTWQLWPRLDEAVRTGGSVFPEVFGKEFFPYLQEDAPDSARVFDRAMTGSSRQAAADLAQVLDLTGVTEVVDIGGGQGHVLAALLEKQPTLRGTLLDLPQVVAGADTRLRDGGPLASRTRLLPGDCRRTVPVSGDLYVIKNVLEWDENSTRRTLRNIMKAARPGASVVIVENLVDGTPSMRFTSAMDLLLLLNVGGAKHSRDSLTALITEAGLRLGGVTTVNAYLHAFHTTVPG